MTAEIIGTEVLIQLGLVALAALVLISQASIIETTDKKGEDVINPLSILYTSVLALGLFETLFYAVVR